MRINVESKYNAGDKVFVLVREDKYNDFYSNDQVWRLKGAETNYYDDELIVKEVIIKAINEGYRVLYSIGYNCYNQEDVFDNLEQAEIERDRRNERDNY